ncbi:hypothetical protein ACFY13_46000, partial [Streptomyces mirabilis]|uniref:hypothetical protein n=1 Tax=Streptomyces mirabilis TaxID=68239 RepID=UPI0036928B4C
EGSEELGGYRVNLDLGHGATVTPLGGNGHGVEATSTQGTHEIMRLCNSPAQIGEADQGSWLPPGEIPAELRLRRQPQH